MLANAAKNPLVALSKQKRETTKLVSEGLQSTFHRKGFQIESRAPYPSKLDAVPNLRTPKTFATTERLPLFAQEAGVTAPVPAAERVRDRADRWAAIWACLARGRERCGECE